MLINALISGIFQSTFLKNPTEHTWPILILIVVWEDIIKIFYQWSHRSLVNVFYPNSQRKETGYQRSCCLLPSPHTQNGEFLRIIQSPKIALAWILHEFIYSTWIPRAVSWDIVPWCKAAHILEYKHTHRGM